MLVPITYLFYGFFIIGLINLAADQFNEQICPKCGQIMEDTFDTHDVYVCARCKHIIHK